MDNKNTNDPIIEALPLYAAVERIRMELQKDKEPGSYYHAWQCNLAMCFYDAYRHVYSFSENNAVLHTIHGIANKAAINFLEILCTQNNDNIGLIRQEQLQAPQQTLPESSQP